MKHFRLINHVMLILFTGLFLGNGLVSATEYQPNLVVNGDFALGNTGFTTDYTYVGTGGSLYPEGTYTVANNPHDFHSDFSGAPYTGDYFLIVNGAEESGKIVWQQEVPVEAGKEYMFSMMVSSLVTAAPADLEITIYINGVAHDQIVVAPNKTNVWKNFTWFSDEDKSGHNMAEITIVETSDIAYGNDFGIDDIQFKELVTCAYSQGYWFAKPGVEWPYDVKLGGDYYTQIEGAAFWPPAGVVNNAFTQYAAIYLSGITLEKYEDLADYMEVIDHYFAGNGITEYDLAEAAGFIGNWINANNCLDCTNFKVEVSVVDVSCFGGNDGRILVEMDGAKPANICLYNECAPEDMNPEPRKTQTAQYNNLSAGWYYIVIVDANGCLHYECIEITEPDPLAVPEKAVVTDALCNGEANGTATIEVVGGTPPFTIDGKNFNTRTILLSDLAAGLHEYELNDVNLCGPVPVSFTVGEPDLLEAKVETLVPATCNGDDDGSALIAVSGGTSPYYYKGEKLIDGKLLLGELQAGEYDALIKDANECEVTVKFEITEPEPLALEIDVTNVSCFGGGDGKIVVNVSGGTGPFDYCLTDDCDDDCNGGYDTKTDDDTTHGGLTAGDYCITVTDANGCTISQKVTITEPDLLEVEVVSIQDVTCNGAADGMAEYLIKGGTPPYTSSLGVVDGDKLTLSALEPDTYSIVVEDFNGCATDPIELIIIEPAELEATVTILNHASCYGAFDGMAELTIAGGTGDYTVDFGDYDWNALCAGEYTCVVTDVNGCVDQVTFEITQPKEIILDIDVTDVTCNGGDDGIIKVNVIDAVGFAQICFFDGCIVPVGCDPVVPSKGLPDGEFGGLSAGWYTIVVVDANGCMAYECVEIKEPDPIAVTLTYDPILCFGGTTEITVSGEGGNEGDLMLFAIDGDDKRTEVGVLPVAVPDVYAGTLNWVVVDKKGCEFPITDIIGQPAKLVVEAVELARVTCYGGNDGQAWIKILGGTPPYTANMGSVTGDVLEIGNLCADDYIVEILDANNCMVEQPLEIVDGPEIFIELVEVVDLMCHETPTGSIEVLATGGNGGFTYSLDGDVYQPTGLFENLLAGEYTVYVKDAEGCTKELENIIVAEPEKLEVDLTVYDVSCNGEADGKIKGYITGGVGPYYTCLITFCADDYINDNPTPDKSQGFMHYDLEPGEYTVMVMDQNGCTWFQCVTIEEPEVLEATITEFTNVEVYGESTGEATVAVSGGTGDYTYLWCTGETSQTATGLAAGKHWVTVTDENGCEATAEVTICQPDETSTSPLSDGNLGVSGDQVALRAYPNPFNSETTIEFELKESGHVTLEVYNIVGEKVAELFDGHVDAFVPQKATLKAGSMPNGIYFYRLNSGNNTFFNKVVLSR